MGLTQNAIEGHGIATVSLTVLPWLTASVGVPRAVALRFPQGNMLGEPRDREQQTAILTHALEAVWSISEPNTILEWPFRWRGRRREQHA